MQSPVTLIVRPNATKAKGPEMIKIFADKFDDWKVKMADLVSNLKRVRKHLKQSA